MRKTGSLLTITGVALAAACHSGPPAEQPTPQPTAAEVAMRQHVQDSLDAAHRYSADSIEQARKAELAARARADSAERVRVAAASVAAQATAKNVELRKELGVMVHFNVARSQVLPEGREALDRKVTILKANPGVRLQITGATDERGSDQYNMALGSRRASEVKRYLVAQGIDAGRLDVLSNGEKSPLETGSDETAWARNRRTEFVVVSGDALLAMK